MAQSALTVTTPNPTPPTNLASTGTTAPNPPNYTKTSYANVFNLTAINTPSTAADGRPQSPYGVNPSPPPYFDDFAASAGSTINEPAAGAASRILFVANKAALASGTGVTSGGTEGTYPGTGTYGSGNATGTVNGVGAVPASTSVANEGAGTEVSVTKVAGSGVSDYNPTVMIPGVGTSYLPAAAAWTEGKPGGPMITASDLGNFTGTANSPNSQHASSLSPSTNPALTSATPGNTTAGAGNTSLAVVGTNFTPQSVIYYNGVAYPTTFTSSTSISVAASPGVPKKATAGTIPVYVVTGGVVVTATVNATYV